MFVIGLISGTSVDAIDAALVQIDRSDHVLKLAVRGFIMQPFDPAVQQRVRDLLPPNVGSTVDVCEVNMLLGEAFAHAARAVANQADVPLDQIELIASHGQTVYHQIAPGTIRSTLQIGSPSLIAERTGCTVVADFRPRDMAAGGEGAPLVSLLDVLLFTDNHRSRALQNIGGIGNVTYLASSRPQPSVPDPRSPTPVLAFDTGPGNVLIDEAVRLLTNNAETFDRDGQRAAHGSIDHVLLAQWLQHPYLHEPPPKSTGRELFGPREARSYVQQALDRGLVRDDTIATLTAFTAHSIAHAYNQYLGRIDEALVGGGGARNPTLMRMIQNALPDTSVRPIDDVGLNADAKEAVAFALIGYATLHGWPGNVPAATGADQPVVLGSITPGANYRSLMRRVIEDAVLPPTRVQLDTEPRHRDKVTG